MIEIAGLIISGIGLLKDLFALHDDLSSWGNEDLEVDRKWLALALQNGILSGEESDYRWVHLSSVPTREMQGTHEVITAHNADRKVLFRIVRGSQDERVVLMKKCVSD